MRVDFGIRGGDLLRMFRGLVTQGSMYIANHIPGAQRGFNVGTLGPMYPLCSKYQNPNPMAL